MNKEIADQPAMCVAVIKIYPVFLGGKTDSNKKSTDENTEINTDRLINTYLKPNATPPKPHSWREAEHGFRGLLSNCFEDRLEKAIQEMEYAEFLKTPYWRIVSYSVKRKFGFKCLMCDSNFKLRVHHKNYSIHGREHTNEAMESMVCVCDSCHSKHHGHHE